MSSSSVDQRLLEALIKFVLFLGRGEDKEESVPEGTDEDEPSDG